jgi:hypothetical protein
VLVVGATGSIGRLVVEEALAHGYDVRALARNEARTRMLPSGATAVVGDLTRPETLSAAVDGIEAVVFTHGSQGGKADMEAVDYRGVRDVLTALGDRPARIALMTLIGITNRDTSYNRSTEGPDWKRRSERLVRASGKPYTIVRPGWFDFNADENKPVFLQGDLRRSGSPSDGGSRCDRSPESSSRASPPRPPSVRHSNSWPNVALNLTTSSLYSQRSTPTPETRSTACATRTTCPSTTSRNASAMTWQRFRSRRGPTASSE